MNDQLLAAWKAFSGGDALVCERGNFSAFQSGWEACRLRMAEEWHEALKAGCDADGAWHAAMDETKSN